MLLQLGKNVGQRAVVLIFSSIVEPPGELSNHWGLGPAPTDSDLIGPGCALDVGVFLKATR